MKKSLLFTMMLAALSLSAAEYIHNLLLSIDSKPYLVLDQFISDGNPNLETHMEYCGNLYEIAVYRDPRDVYVSGIIGNEAWIPHNPVDFVKWYRQRVEQYIDTPHQNRLLIRFEDMVMDYNHTTDKILSFLQLDTEAHVKKQRYFDPEISSKNIGIYQSFDDQLSIQIIEQELQKYCYNQFPVFLLAHYKLQHYVLKHLFHYTLLVFLLHHLRFAYFLNRAE